MITSPASKLDTVHSVLRGRIERGEWKLGDRLPTASELAKSLGCSIGMVSKAIAMLVHEGFVEQRTRVGTRVISNSRKSSIAPMELDAFAFIYPSDQHEGIWRTVKGFQEAAHGVDRKVVTITTGTDFRRESESIVRLSEFDVKAAAIYSTAETLEDQALISQALVRSSFPVVLSCVGVAGLNLPSVFFDDFHAGYTMTKYLLQKGLTRIGFLSSVRTQMSFRGYRWALEEAGVFLDADLVRMEKSMQANYTDLIEEPTRLADSYLKNTRNVEGVVCGFDYFAAGLINAAQKRGLRVPEDLKVVGIDDFALGSSISLTTYHVPYEAIGRRTFEVLSRLERGRPLEILEEHIKGHIVIRDSA